jgi:hypothetical protein
LGIKGVQAATMREDHPKFTLRKESYQSNDENARLYELYSLLADISQSRTCILQGAMQYTAGN